MDKNLTHLFLLVLKLATRLRIRASASAHIGQASNTDNLR